MLRRRSVIDPVAQSAQNADVRCLVVIAVLGCSGNPSTTPSSHQSVSVAAPTPHLVTGDDLEQMAQRQNPEVFVGFATTNKDTESIIQFRPCATLEVFDVQVAPGAISNRQRLAFSGRQVFVRFRGEMTLDDDFVVPDGLVLIQELLEVSSDKSSAFCP